MPITLIGDIFALLIFGAAFAGPLASYCKNNPGAPGCIHSKRNFFEHLARADVGPCNVPKYNFDLCHNQVRDQVNGGTLIWSSIPSYGVAQFENVPPACMDLAVVLSGSCTGDSPRPIPCGSACIQYVGVTDEQMGTIASHLNH